MKKLILKSLLMVLLFSSSKALAQPARVQVIHNSADPAASIVDVYVNGNLLLDNIAFRTASPFINAPSGVPLSIAIAPSTSTSVADAIATFPITLVANAKYVVVANGIVSATGFNPNQPFDLDIYPLARETSTVTGNTDVLVAHGSTDAPGVDVVAVGAGTVVNNLVYGTFNPYLELPTANYTLNVKDSANTTVLASYSAPLQTLGLQNQALVVVASGFLNPANNSNSTNTFGLWVALSAGGPLVQLPQSQARVQIIHNSADPAAATVDVYLGAAKLLDNVAFRTATAFINAPAETAQVISVAPSTSTGASDAIATFPITLAANAKYVVVANGIVSATGFNPNQPFDLDIYPLARETSTVTGNTDVLVAHGSTDAPGVDVVAVGAGTVVNNLVYGTFNPYLELPTANYTLQVKDSANTIVLASYSAPLQTLGLQNQALVVVASGFLNPANNSNSTNTFGLWVALSAGGPLVQLSSSVGISTIKKSEKIKIYPNPTSDIVTVEIELSKSDNLRIEMLDVTGKIIYSRELGKQNAGLINSTIDVSQISNGLYVLKVIQGNEQKTNTISVNH